MAAIITEKFRQHNAEQFFESFSEAAASNYYLFIGKASPFTTSTSGGTDTTPPTPQDIVTVENYKWDSMLAAKKIGPQSLSIRFCGAKPLRPAGAETRRLATGRAHKISRFGAHA